MRVTRERLIELIRTLVENDPDELIADGGITVLDGWRKEAIRCLEREKEMPIERYCTKEGCPGGDGCTNEYRTPGKSSCTFEYDASRYEEQYRWKGEGNPPSRWRATDGTVVYRSYSDYCD